MVNLEPYSTVLKIEKVSRHANSISIPLTAYITGIETEMLLACLQGHADK